MVVRCAFLALLVLALTSCQSVWRPKDADVEVQRVFDLLQSRNSNALITRFEPRLQAKVAAQLPSVMPAMPEDAPLSRRRIYSSMRLGTDGETILARDEYDYASSKLLVYTRLHRASRTETWRITDLKLRSETKDDLRFNDFEQNARHLGRQLSLLVLLSSPVVMFAAIVKVVRTRELRRKWLWCVLALFGVGRATLNWSTGGLHIDLFNLGFLSSGAWRSTAFDPWLFITTFPLGGILILAGYWANPARARRKALPADARGA